jgi:hypothetical protein
LLMRRPAEALKHIQQRKIEVIQVEHVEYPH